MTDKKRTYSIDLGGTLLIVFLVLKLAKVIDWSWWWILSPIWIPFALVFILGLVYALIKCFEK